MTPHNDLIKGIQHRILHRTLEKIPGMAHEILIQGILLGKEKNEGITLPSTYPATPLPGRHDGAGIADQNADIKISYVNAELKGAGGNNAQQLTVGQPRLDFPPILRQEPGPICGKLLPQRPEA